MIVPPKFARGEGSTHRGEFDTVADAYRAAVNRNKHYTHKPIYYYSLEDRPWHMYDENDTRGDDWPLTVDPILDPPTSKIIRAWKTVRVTNNLTGETTSYTFGPKKRK